MATKAERKCGGDDCKGEVVPTIHFSHVLMYCNAQQDSISDADIDYVFDAFIAAAEERGLFVAGGCHPCGDQEEVFCAHCDKKATR